jgi:hypothetical protein
MFEAICAILFMYGEVSPSVMVIEDIFPLMAFDALFAMFMFENQSSKRR